MKGYRKSSNSQYRIPRRSQKRDYNRLKAMGIIERKVKCGKPYSIQGLRKVGLDPRTTDPEELGLIHIPIEGNQRTRVYLRPNRKLQVIDLSK